MARRHSDGLPAPDRFESDAGDAGTLRTQRKAGGGDGTMGETMGETMRTQGKPARKRPALQGWPSPGGNARGRAGPHECNACGHAWNARGGRKARKEAARARRRQTRAGHAAAMWAAAARAWRERRERAAHSAASGFEESGRGIAAGQSAPSGQFAENHRTATAARDNVRSPPFCIEASFFVSPKTRWLTVVSDSAGAKAAA